MIKKIKEINIGDVIDLKDHEHTILRSHVIFNDVGTVTRKENGNNYEQIFVKLKNKYEYLNEWDNCLVFDSNAEELQQSINGNFKVINRKEK
jgi:hypothetical protein